MARLSSAEIFIITTKWKFLLFQEKNGTNYLANNVLILVHSHLDITMDIISIHEAGVSVVFFKISVLHTIPMILKGGMVTQSTACFELIGVRPIYK